MRCVFIVERGLQTIDELCVLKLINNIMPLIIVTGLPSSGKTHRTNELKEYLIGRGKKVRVISENSAIPKAGFRKNEYYEDSKKEKMVRSDLKSEALRLLNKDDVTILDAGNYIKGTKPKKKLVSKIFSWLCSCHLDNRKSRIVFVVTCLPIGYRYELYCASKAARTTQCTIFCGISKDRALEFNERKTVSDEVTATVGDTVDNSDVPYTSEIFAALCHRYEEPQANNRWDSPLFVIVPDSTIEFNDVFAVLYEKKPPPPNLSTQNVSDANTVQMHCANIHKQTLSEKLHLHYLPSTSVMRAMEMPS